LVKGQYAYEFSKGRMLSKWYGLKLTQPQDIHTFTNIMCTFCDSSERKNIKIPAVDVLQFMLEWNNQ